MPDVDSYDILILGSGESGKYLAWTMAAAGHRTAVIERKLIGGSCPNVACLPSKNIIHSAKVKSLALRASAFGLDTGAIRTDMKAVQERKRRMVADLIKVHVGRYEAAGVDLIMGSARFVGPETGRRSSREALTQGRSRASACFSMWAHARPCPTYRD